MTTQPAKKREDYLAWEEYFMAMAFLAAKRSKDPSTQVGACIVNEDKKIVGLGYNGLPIGVPDDQFPWGKSPNPLESKYTYVCHAEVNAVLNKNSADLKNCTLYVALFPCNECAKIIIQSRIKDVVYMSDKHAHKPEVIASKQMLDVAGIKYRQYKPSARKIVIDFADVERTQDFDQTPTTPFKQERSEY